MPFQNRVTPFGQIIATEARGTLMGNRGCLHGTGNHLLRQYQSRRWIICVLDFKGRTRTPMPPGQYTSLFFLDEATALAAGHRPCAECQRKRFTVFRSHWAAANPDLAGSSTPLVDTIDSTLHDQRISRHRYQRDMIKLTYSARLAELPDGTCVVLPNNDTTYLVHGGWLFPWSIEGYGEPIRRPMTPVQVLTPRSTVRALAHGYRPAMHPTAFTAMD
ncbi:MAG: hypothetical protein SH847_09645 [Roseiflexaceae bacterium]|nr:hypothetical protein [Roseiflexaceae bacterium]